LRTGRFSRFTEANPPEAFRALDFRDESSDITDDDVSGPITQADDLTQSRQCEQTVELL